ncbi:MAG: ATP-binding protein [Lachnospiraceae bacterium]|nr:ATP-binding protein [Lachnospiraceae bacterium]
MIKREKYIEKIRGFYDSDLIKIITGVRRCGKSVILEAIMDEIKNKTDNIIYLNFENASTFEMIEDGIKLIDYVNKNRKQGKCYVFLDEIQLLDKFYEGIKTLRLHDNSIFVTGSNSTLLSSEIMKYFSGREVSFTIRPFVYKELLEYANELGKEISINDYLVWGGFPKRLEFNSEEDVKNYLIEVENTIIINDLIARYKIKKDQLFKKVARYIFKNNSRIFSSKSVYDYIKNEKTGCSINTIIKFVNYLKEGFVVDAIERYSSKAKRELLYYEKLYLVDVCFNSLRVIDSRYDLEHNLENIVYNELLYMGYSLQTFDNNGKEIDFIAYKNNKKYYIQVAYSILHDKTYDREMGAFANLDNMVKKIIITNDDIDYSTSTVVHIKLKDFLMMNDLDNL